MEFFTYEFCKELLVYTGAGIIIVAAIGWYAYILIEIVIKLCRLISRIVKKIKAKKTPDNKTTDSEKSI